MGLAGSNPSRLPQAPVPRGQVEGHRDAGLDHAAPVGNRRAVERVWGPVFSFHHAPAGGCVKAGNRAGEGSAAGGQAQWTILASGSSMMSLAPASRRSGINTLMSVLGTTVSTA